MGAEPFRWEPNLSRFGMTESLILVRARITGFLKKDLSCWETTLGAEPF